MDEQYIIDTTVGPLAVRVVGEGPATAVLWSSLFMDGRSWDRVLPALAQERCLVVIDGPGHGGSGDPGHRYSLRDCVAAAGQVLDRLAVKGRVDWVGNAWGGQSACGSPPTTRRDAGAWSPSEHRWRPCPGVNVVAPIPF